MMSASDLTGGPPAPVRTDTKGAARIGPNSVLQTLRALRELEGSELAAQVGAALAPPESWAQGMIPEAWFASIVQAVRVALPEARGEAVMRRSGTYTAEYVRQHRIPSVFRALLRLLPKRLSVPLLLRAFARHAWTFAGAGRFAFDGPFPGALTLDGCPTCRPGAAASSRPCGAYYEAAFEGLLRLAAPQVRIREVACQAAGAPLCRFAIVLTDPTAGRPCEFS